MGTRAEDGGGGGGGEAGGDGAREVARTGHRMRRRGLGRNRDGIFFFLSPFLSISFMQYTGGIKSACLLRYEKQRVCSCEARSWPFRVCVTHSCAHHHMHPSLQHFVPEKEQRNENNCESEKSPLVVPHVYIYILLIYRRPVPCFPPVFICSPPQLSHPLFHPGNVGGYVMLSLLS